MPIFLNKFIDIISIEIGRNRLSMENSVFLSFDGDSLFSHVKIYESNSTQKIHLIPVIHIGTKDYFHKIVEYVGKIPCIFENLKFGAESNELNVPVKNFNDFIKIYSITSDKVWNNYNSLVKRFYKKYINKDLKKINKSVQKLVYRFNGNIKLIYELCQKTNFDVSNLIMIQLFLCDILQLEHQFIAIDYENDITNRPNWIHSDLNFEDLIQQVDIDDLIKKLLTDPTHEQINEAEKQMNLVISAIWGSLHLLELSDIHQRRRKFAHMVLEELAVHEVSFKDVIPELYFDTRNNLVLDTLMTLLEGNDEIMIFYGASHIIRFEKYLIENGFVFNASKTFEVFNS